MKQVKIIDNKGESGICVKLYPEDLIYPTLIEEVRLIGDFQMHIPISLLEKAALVIYTDNNGDINILKNRY